MQTTDNGRSSLGSKAVFGRIARRPVNVTVVTVCLHIGGAWMALCWIQAHAMKVAKIVIKPQDCQEYDHDIWSTVPDEPRWHHNLGQSAALNTIKSFFSQQNTTRLYGNDTVIGRISPIKRKVLNIPVTSRKNTGRKPDAKMIKLPPKTFLRN